MNRLVIPFLIILCFVFMGTASAWTEKEKTIIDEANYFFNTPAKDNPRSIDNTELQEKMEDKNSRLFLLDVRNSKDFKEKRIKASKDTQVVNLPQKDLFRNENLASIPKDREIIVICYTGSIASQMVPLLHMLGYRAIALRGGIEEWDVQGLPLEK